MKKVIFAMFFLMLVVSVSENRVQAQESSTYSSAIGGRFGVANGFTYKYFLNESHAIDGIVNFQGNKSFGLFKLVGLYKIHMPIYFVEVDGLQWYYGGGAGIGSYRDKEVSQTDFAFSFDGVVGLDYKVPTAPINISLDWKPTMELTPHPGLRFEGFGLSIRYVLF